MITLKLPMLSRLAAALLATPTLLATLAICAPSARADQSDYEIGYQDGYEVGYEDGYENRELEREPALEEAPPLKFPGFQQNTAMRGKRIKLEAGYYSSLLNYEGTPASHGTVIRAEAGERRILTGRERPSKTSDIGMVEKLKVGFGVDPRVKAEVQLRQSGDNAVERYDVHGNLISLVSVLKQGYEPDAAGNLAPIPDKTIDLDVGRVGFEVSKDSRTQSEVKAVALTPIDLRLERRGQSDTPGKVGALVCGSLKPVTFLVGESDAADARRERGANEPDRVWRRRTGLASDVMEMSGCIGSGVGENG